MVRYAEATSVPVERSKAEIESLLARYGASSFMSGWDQVKAVIQFDIDDRRIRMVLPLPDRAAPEFNRTPTGKQRATAAALTAWEQACRQRWRALLLVLKAQLEAVETGIVTFDEAWLAYIVLPDGTTVGERALPQVTEAYANPELPPLLELGR